jgi:hypothetical protein
MRPQDPREAMFGRRRGDGRGCGRAGPSGVGLTTRAFALRHRGTRSDAVYLASSTRSCHETVPRGCSRGRADDPIGKSQDRPSLEPAAYRFGCCATGSRSNCMAISPIESVIDSSMTYMRDQRQYRTRTMWTAGSRRSRRPLPETLRQ